MQYIKLRINILLIDANLKQCHTMDCVFHLIELGELRFVHMLIHHTVDTCSGLILFLTIVRMACP